jgi:phosphoribosyl 1,2-cyclic phosphodiesterase
MMLPFFVKFWGTRGSIPTPGNRTKRFGGNTSCVEIRSGEHVLICDAGSGIRELGADIMTRGLSPIVTHLFLTHAHWDHIQGFPFFVPAYVPQSQCHIYGINEGDDRFYRLLSGQMTSDYFPVSFAELRANIHPCYLKGGAGQIGDIRVATMALEHPGGCLGYAFSRDNVKVVYATDNEIDRLLSVAARSGGAHGEIRRAPAVLVDFARNADLLIADGQYTDAEYLGKVGWGHSSCITVVDLAVQAGVKQLAIFHHDPARSDADVDQLIETCRKRAAELASDLIVFGAREGVEFRI